MFIAHLNILISVLWGRLFFSSGPMSPLHTKVLIGWLCNRSWSLARVVACCHLVHATYARLPWFLPWQPPTSCITDARYLNCVAWRNFSPCVSITLILLFVASLELIRTSVFAVLTSSPFFSRDRCHFCTFSSSSFTDSAMSDRPSVCKLSN